jgi:hypothetical protein
MPDQKMAYAAKDACIIQAACFSGVSGSSFGRLACGDEG